MACFATRVAAVAVALVPAVQKVVINVVAIATRILRMMFGPLRSARAVCHVRLRHGASAESNLAHAAAALVCTPRRVPT